MKEEWIDIEGYEGFYQISSIGRVKSFHRKKPKILVCFISKNGYVRIELNLKGKAKKYPVHRLVALGFIKTCNTRLEVNHIDGNKLNNNLVNLEWCTPSENQIHAFKTGLQVSRKGIDHHGSKLTEKDVVEIRSLYSTGNYKQVELAEMFGLHSRYVNLIIKKRRWKHVK
tara:strand:- start:717 stop:1226 length:510 start_codon:yes stop_codon:yes gene_type:complete